MKHFNRQLARVFFAFGLFLIVAAKAMPQCEATTESSASESVCRSAIDKTGAARVVW